MKFFNVLVIYVFNLEKGDICVDKSRGYIEWWRFIIIMLGFLWYNVVGFVECVLGVLKGVIVELFVGIKEDII